MPTATVALPRITDAASWSERVRPLVKPERFAHIERVATLARDIAKANGLNAEKAYLAGILHDVARDMSSEELLRLAPAESEMDLLHPLIVHGRAGRALLERWGFRDEEILDAVEEHTTGPREGRPISVCVYVADISEPGRGVNDHIRELAMTDLEAAYREALLCKVHYLQGRGKPVHPRTMDAYRRLVALDGPGPRFNCEDLPVPR